MVRLRNSGEGDHGHENSLPEPSLIAFHVHFHWAGAGRSRPVHRLARIDIRSIINSRTHGQHEWPD